MSDIDEIALDVVKAIGNIDPDKLPGGRTQAVAQAQVLVRDAINGEAKALQSENKALRMGLDEARSKYVQNLKSFQSEAIAICQPEPVFWWDGDLSDLDDCVRKGQSAYHTIPLYTQPQSAVSEAFILRKQAEAFESAAKRLSKNKAEWSWQAQQEMLHTATTYRQQADELEQQNE